MCSPEITATERNRLALLARLDHARARMHAAFDKLIDAEQEVNHLKREIAELNRRKESA